MKSCFLTLTTAGLLLTSGLGQATELNAIETTQLYIEAIIHKNPTSVEQLTKMLEQRDPLIASMEKGMIETSFSQRNLIFDMASDRIIASLDQQVTHLTASKKAELTKLLTRSNTATKQSFNSIQCQATEGTSIEPAGIGFTSMQVTVQCTVMVPEGIQDITPPEVSEESKKIEADALIDYYSQVTAAFKTLVPAQFEYVVTLDQSPTDGIWKIIDLSEFNENVLKGFFAVNKKSDS